MENKYSIILPIPRLAYYNDLSLDEYYNYFTKDTEFGGSISDIILYHNNSKSNNYLRRGGGFWSYVGQLAKKTLPFINKFLLPEAINVGQSLLEKHQSKGKISKEDLSNISKDSVKRIVKKVISGSGKTYKGKPKLIKRENKDRIKKKLNKQTNTSTNKKKTNKRQKLNRSDCNIFSLV